MGKPGTISTQRKLKALGGYQPLLRGRDAQITKTSHGQHLIHRPNEEWSHPWHINAGWDYNLGRWCIWVTPGFINGYPAVIPIETATIKKKTVIDLPDPRSDYGSNPLNGQKNFSAWIFNEPKDQTGQIVQQVQNVDTTDVYITDEMEPFLIADQFFNPIAPTIVPQGDGTSVAVGGNYPKFFTLCDVKPPQDASSANTSLGGVGTVTNSFSANLQEPGNRELRSVDVVLVAEHYAVKSDVYQTDPATGSITIVSSAFTTAPTRFPLRLRIQDRWVSPPAYPTIEDRLNGRLDEPTFDELLIARLWLVSPPNADSAAIPDESWEPFYEHRVFWNLGYTQPNYVPSPIYKPVTINIPLGVGLLALIGNQALAPLNDANQNILNALNQSTSKGEFYTA